MKQRLIRISLLFVLILNGFNCQQSIGDARLIDALLYGLALISIGLVLSQHDKQQAHIQELEKLTLTISPGELADRHTINQIKALKLTGEQAVEAETSAEQEWRALLIFCKEHQLSSCLLLPLVTRLYALNYVQWELEDKFRQDKNWEAALRARENNNDRIRMKNQINQLFGSKLEHKRYQT